MFKMNKYLLIITGFFASVLTVEAYCSCKCDTPEIPYTRVSYAVPVPNVPYKYTAAANAIQQVNHILRTENDHSKYIAAPIVILPHVTNHLQRVGTSDYHGAVENLHVSSQQQLQSGSLQNSISSQELVSDSYNIATAHNTQDSVHHQFVQHIQGGDHHDNEHEDHYDHYKKKNHNVHYKFDYAVNDHKTGDIKRHQEERKGDDVVGEYSLLEEDGNVRTVKYQADWKTGFHAQVFNSKPRHG